MGIRNPDPIWHRNISLGKSAVRIIAGICLCSGALVSFGLLFIIAEILGVTEELV